MSEKLLPEFLTGKEVLIIDDDPNSLDVASILLDFVGAKVILAENGQQGLEYIKARKPALVISDISMPIMDGWQLIEKLRADNDYEDLIAIALTAHSMIGDREKVMIAGYNGYLTKPLQPSTFINALMAVLQKVFDARAVSMGTTKD